MSGPAPSFEPASTNDAADDSAIGSVTVLVYSWTPGASEVRVKFPAGAVPGEPNAVAEQGRFRERVIADVVEALTILGGP
jgi:hypothetical protein